MKVIYIAGPSRSGSTLLSNILGELDGMFNAGELIDIWDRAILWNGRCSCGETFGSCAVWTRIMRTAFADAAVDVDAMIRMRDAAARSRHVPGLLCVPRCRANAVQRLEPYLASLRRLYRGIGEATASDVVVDASKNVGYAYLLSLLGTLDLYYVHLVRDARATAYSWLRKKAGLWSDHPARVALTWVSRNLAAELVGRACPSRYVRIRYEDFIRNPRDTVRGILERVGEPRARLPFDGLFDVQLGVGHSMYGNPDRFRSGRVTVKGDEAWTSGLRAADRRMVVALTWFLLLRYRYISAVPRRPGSRPAAPAPP